MNLTLIEAFGRFGAKPSFRQNSLSAIAADGAMVLNCCSVHFGHPSAGVLRYEDRLSRDPSNPAATDLLGQHLTLARDGALPVRMVVSTPSDATSGKAPRSVHVRPDLVGRVVTFDGDHYVIDFVRRPELHPSATRR